MCKRPLARCEKLGETYINKQGKISYKCDFIPWADVERNLKYYQMKYRKVDMIPCSNCIECRLQKSRDKANQMMLEKMCYTEDECWFLTLTYDDLHIPTHKTVNTETGEIIEGISLKKEDAQKFIKRLRAHYQRKYGKNIRYVICGEYGSETHRPHYHAIIYGMPLDQSKLKLYKHNEMGQSIWTHKELEEKWGMGFVTVGRVTWESCAYVARYLMKKQYGKEKWYYGAIGAIPEFIQQSLKPPIGRNYLLDHIDEIVTYDQIPIANKKTAQLVKPPKSFDNYLMNLFPEEVEENKRKRKKYAQEAQQIKNQYTDLTPQQQREIKAEAIEHRSKALIRKEI